MATKNKLFGFRIVIRGTNSDGKRVRRVVTVQARSYKGVDMAGVIAKRKAAAGLKNVYCKVFPPLV